MTFSKKHLYDLAVAEVGYKGSPDDWEAAKKALLSATNADGDPEPIEEVRFGDQTINIRELVFTKSEKPKGRRVSFMVDPNDDVADREDKFNAAVAAAVEKEIKAGKVRNNGRVQQISESTNVGTVKSGEERMYEHRIANKTSAFKSYDMALGFGRDIQVKALKALGKFDEADELFKKTAEALTQKGYTLTTTATGSALVPEGYDADLHQLIRSYGVARRVCRNVPMASETIVRPKATGDLTVYYPADGSAGTESTKTWSNVQMRAKTGMVIVKASRQLTQDAAINVADDAGRDIVRAVAKCEDSTLFNADGTGVAGGYIPGCQGILNIISESTTGERLYKSTATSVLGVTLSDVIALMSTPGSFVGLNPAFHCTPQIASAVLHRLASASGGVTMKEVEGFGQVATFFGIPIITNNVMTTNLGTASVECLIYGDISLAADFGDRMGISVEISEQRYWDENNIGIKGTVRHDINVHGLGTSTTTGPLAVLLTS